ncbi:hypothetical protein B046DRAFT_07000 [Streptomyces sp. LamerLS-316]|nr:hypothetical protein B046DRAFT_07000 [Streptomyces sp. LamerLS-316]
MNCSSHDTGLPAARCPLFAVGLRARDLLYVSWCGARSGFLAESGR